MPPPSLPNLDAHPALAVLRAARFLSELDAMERRERLVAQYDEELAAARESLETAGRHTAGDDWRCGALTRGGKRCGAWPVCGSRRCRMHGGASTGPKTAEGRARSLANLRRGG